MCIPVKEIDFFLPHIIQHVTASLRRAHSDLKPAHVIRKLKSGDARLWIVWDGEKIMSATTTEICGVPGESKILIITTHGGLTKTWDKFLPELEEFAKFNECSEVRIYGRQGWVRALDRHGYKPLWVALTKQV
jgi:hypothetical protein